MLCIVTAPTESIPKAILKSRRLKIYLQIDSEAFTTVLERPKVTSYYIFNDCPQMKFVDLNQHLTSSSLLQKTNKNSKKVSAANNLLRFVF